MNTKLEEKLQEINSKDPILNDEDLLNVLESIIDTEVNNHVEKMDTELLNSAVEFKMSIKGIDLDKVTVASEKHVENYLSKFHREVVENGVNKPKKKLKKPFKYVFSAAAVIAAMTVTIFATCIALDFDFMDLKTFLGLERGVEHNDGNYSLTINENKKEYTSIEEFISKEDTTGLLLPSAKENKIHVINDQASKQILFILNNTDSTILIDFQSQTSLENFDCIKINKYDVLILDLEEQIQGVFVHNNNSYSVVAPSIEQLTDIINNLKEY